MSSRLGQVQVVVSGLLGAAGVALSAVAAHQVQDAALATAASIMLLHAAASLAVLAVARRSQRTTAFIAADLLLQAGAVVFAGDVALRSLTGHRLFPLAAPTGGMTMIAGWLAVAIAGMLEWRGSSS